MGQWKSVFSHILCSADQVRIRLILQLISGISTSLEKILKYLNGAVILKSFVPSFPVLPAVFVLILNEALLLLSGGKPVIIAPLVSENVLP